MSLRELPALRLPPALLEEVVRCVLHTLLVLRALGKVEAEVEAVARLGGPAVGGAGGDGALSSFSARACGEGEESAAATADSATAAAAAAGGGVSGGDGGEADPVRAFLAAERMVVPYTRLADAELQADVDRHARDVAALWRRNNPGAATVAMDAATTSSPSTSSPLAVESKATVLVSFYTKETRKSMFRTYEQRVKWEEWIFPLVVVPPDPRAPSVRRVADADALVASVTSLLTDIADKALATADAVPALVRENSAGVVVTFPYDVTLTTPAAPAPAAAATTATTTFPAPATATAETGGRSSPSSPTDAAGVSTVAAPPVQVSPVGLPGARPPPHTPPAATPTATDEEPAATGGVFGVLANLFKGDPLL